MDEEIQMDLITYDQARDQTHEPPHDPSPGSNSTWQAADLSIRRWYRQREEILAQMQQVQLLLSSASAINAASIVPAMLSPSGSSLSWLSPSRIGASLLVPSLGAASSLSQALSHLCQQIIDYVAVAHFVIYVQLIKPSELSCANTLLQLYRTIGTTTDSVLTFNALFDRIQWLHPASELDKQLDWLDKQLHTRFTLEDALLNLMEACSPRRTNPGLSH